MFNEVKLFDLPDLLGADFSRHNDEVAALWNDFVANRHERVPVTLVCNPRVLFLNPQYNPRGVQYKDYFEDAAVMGQVMLEFQYWLRFMLPGDHPHGLPDKWTIWIDFANTYDAAYFGGKIEYRRDQVPDAVPLLDDERKHMLFDRGLPDPFSGEWPQRCEKIAEAWDAECASGWTFLGVPVAPALTGQFGGTDGLFTTACALRSPERLCIDMLEDPDYARQLLDFVYEATAARMRAWRRRFGAPIPQDDFISADDSIELLSVEQYREFVLPLHKRLYDEFATGKGRAIHLCGNVQRHLLTIKDELGIEAFDTGFPIDFARFRREMGPDVQCSGGPAVWHFLQDTPESIEAETERILRSGIVEGSRFILREGNNLPPLARLDLCQAFYAAGKRFGRR